MLSHQSLYNYYKTTFSLLTLHKYGLDDMEGMIPFEREVYIALLMQHLQEEKEKFDTQKLQNGR